MDMYSENILDHYESPRNFGHLKEFDSHAHDKNPLCGDTFDVELKVENEKVKEVAFSGHGCAISTASASMLSEKIIGMALKDVEKLDKEDILKLLGIELSHVRIKCAMLPLKVVKIGIYEIHK
ncbi:MAG: Fe-S cluster assembly sulfur transfer protein SufU [archaeon]